MSETGDDKMKIFHLHLQQQNIKTVERHLEITCDSPNLEDECIVDDNIEEEIRNLLMSVMNEQTKENSLVQACYKQWTQYQDLRELVYTIVDYLECLKVIKKTSQTFIQKVSGKFLQLDTPAPSENIDFVGRVDGLQEHLLEIVPENVENNLMDLWQDLESTNKNYGMAAKNLRILVEILDFGHHDLHKLKNQYEEILCHLQQARSNVQNELPNIIGDFIKALRDGLSVWGSLQNSFTNESSEFAVLVGDLKNTFNLSDK